MEDRLKNLKNSLKNDVFNELHFNEEHKAKVKHQIKKLRTTSDIDPLLAVLQLLMEKRTGFELSKLLRARGVVHFEDHEGALYTLLHRVEQKGLVQAHWFGDAKYYEVTSKGKKILVKSETAARKPVFKELFEG